MGLIIDSDIFITMEKEGMAPDFNQFRAYGDAFISAITISELLVGVHRASGQSRRYLGFSFGRHFDRSFSYPPDFLCVSASLR